MQRLITFFIILVSHVSIIQAQPDHMGITTQPQNTEAGQVVAGNPVVTVYDDLNNPVGAGIEVTVSVNIRGFAEGSTDTVNTNTSGEAVFDNLVLDTADTNYQLTFSSDGLGDVTSNSFDVTSSSPDSMNIITQPGDTIQGDPLPGPPAIKLFDAYENPVQGIDITVSVNQNSLNGTLTVTTGSDGTAVFPDLSIDVFDSGYKLIFDADDAQAVAVENDTSQNFQIYEEQATLSITNQPVNSVKARPVEGHNVIEGPAVLLENMSGDPLNNIEIVALLSGGSFAGDTKDTITTNAQGYAIFDSLIIDAAANGYQIVFTTGTNTVADVTTNTFDVLTATGTLTFDQQPEESIENYPVEGPPAVYLENGGTPLNGIEITAHITKNNFKTGSKDTIITNGSGIAVFDSLLLQTIDTDYQVVFKALQPGVATITSDSFDVVEELAVLNVQKQPELTIAGEPLNGPPSVQLTDKSTGNPPGSPVNVYAYLNKNDFTGESDTIATATTENNGIAIFDSLIIDQDDSEYEIRFSTNSPGIADVMTDSFEVIPVAGNMTIDPQPRDTIEGYPIAGPPSVTLLDNNSDPMPDIQVVGQLNKDTFALGTDTLTTDANGIAIFDDLVIDAPDTDYNIFFKVDDTTGVVSQTSTNFDIHDETAVLTIQNQPTLTIEGELINGSPSVLVEDTNGIPVSNVTIYASLNKGHFSAGDSIVKTNASGIAVFDSLVIDSVDTDYKLIFSAQAPSIANARSNAFDIIPVAGNISITQQPQETVEGYTVEGPPSVQILRNDGTTPMDGLDVTATTNQNSFSGSSSTTVTTDASGVAVFDNLILDQAAENYEITFTLNVSDSVPDTTTAQFDVVNEVAVMSVQNQPQLTIAGETINGPPSVKLETPGGDPINGGTIYASVNQSGFNAQSVTTATTNSSGIATFDSLIIDDANTGYEITFSSNSSGIAPITSNAFEISAPQGIMHISQQPQETVNGETVEGPPAITIKEMNGDPWNGNEIDVTVSVNKNGFSSGTLTKTTTNGEAVFGDLIMNSIDNDYKLTFSTDISEGIADTVSNPFNVLAMTGMLQVWVQPSETVAGDPVNGPPVVKLTDLLTNPVPGVEITVSLNKNNFNGSSTLTATTNDNGEAYFDNLIIDDFDTGYEITFSAEASGVPDVTSNSFEVTDASLSMSVTTQPQTSTAGNAVIGHPAVTVSNGGPIEDVTVTASINKNNFTGTSNLTAVTNSSGIATFDNLVINSADTDYKITFNADYSGVPNAESNAFEVTHASPDHITVSTEPSETQAGSIINGPPTAILLDEYNNPIDGEDISVVPNQNGGSFSGTDTKSTNSNGKAVFDDITLTTSADDYQLFFTHSDVPGVNSDFFAITNAPADTIKILTQPSETVAGAAISGPPVVSVEDEYSNPVEGETVTISEEGGYTIDGGTLSLTTDSIGEATFSDLVINTVDAGYQFRFTTGGIHELSNTFNVVPGTIFSRFHGSTHSGFTSFPDNNHQLGQIPARIEVVAQPQESVVGTEVVGPPEIVVYDNTDEPVPDVSVTVNGASFGSGTTTLTTDATGHITFDDLVIDTKGSYNLTFEADNHSSVTAQSNSFDVIDALATMSMNVQPLETMAGQPLEGHPTIILENSIGMPVDGVDVTVYINQHNFTSGTMTVTTDENGLAVFDDLVINKADKNYQLFFDADYTGVQNITSNSFDVMNAPADKITVETQPKETFQGATIEGPPVAKVTDQFDNPVSGTDVSVAEVVSGAIDAGITTISTDKNGLAEFSTLVINNKGTYQLSFSATGVSSASSNTFQVVPGTVANRFKGSSHSGFGRYNIENTLLGQTPVRMQVVTNPLETVAGFNIEGPPTIAVYDAVDDPVSNVQVTVNAIGGSLDNGTFTRTTNEQGRIIFNDLQINTPGPYQLSFSADNHSATVSDIQTETFEVVDQVYTMQIETQPQNTVAGQTIGGTPKISIKNYINQPLSGVDVTVYINQHQFDGGSMTVQTDENGEAVFNDLVINTASPNYQLIFDADHSGISNVSSALFDITHAPPSTLSVIQQPEETVEGAAIEGPPAVKLSDNYNNPIASETISVSETGGYSFDGGTTSLTTNQNGAVTFNNLIINTIGSYSLTFNHASVGDVTSQNFNIKSGTVANRFKGSSHSGFGRKESNDKLLGQTPARMEVTSQPLETVLGTTLEGPPKIVVYDEQDNTVANVDVSVTVTGGFKPGSSTQLTTDDNGEITFDNLVIDSVGNYQLNFSADNHPSVTSQSEAFDVIDQQLFLSVTTQPEQTIAGQTLAGHPTVKLANSIGQGYEGVDVTVYINQHSFSSAPSTQTVTTDASGFAEFDQLVINKAEKGYQLLFDADYSGVLNVSSNSFEVVNAAVDHLSIDTDPEDTESGATIGGYPAVSAYDAYNNPVSGVNVSVSETGGYSFDNGTTTVTTNENGSATFNNLVINTIGQYSLTYSASGVTDLVSGVFNVVSGTVSYRFRGNTHSGFNTLETVNKYLGQTPTRIEINVQPMETIVSDAIEGPPKVTVYDELDNPVSGVSINADVNGFFTSGSVDTIITDANGEAVFDNLVIDETGNYTLIFEAVGYGDVDVVNSESFDVVDQVLNASIVTQPGASVAGTPVSGAPAVKLENDFGQGFQGVDVIAYINQNSFSLTSTDTVTTDANGLATFNNLILEKAAENYQVIFEVDYSGVNNISSNFFDVSPAPASQLEIITQPEEGFAEATIEGPPEVVLYDDYNNPISNVSITVSEDGGYSIDAGTFTQSTDENGRAAFNDLVINTAGAYTLNFSASVGGVPDTQSQPFNILPGEIADRFKGGSHSGFNTQEENQVLLKQEPKRIVIVSQPEQSVISTPVQGPPMLKVYDQTDNEIQNAAVTATIVGGTPTLSGTKTLATNSSGEVLFDDISIDQTGTYQLHFEVGGYPDVEVNSQEFDVINQTLSMSMNQQPQNTQAGQIIGGPPAVAITNEIGQPAPAGINVIVYTNQNDFSSDPANDTVQTDASGIAVFDQLSIDVADDDYQLIFEADYPGVSSIMSDVFAISPASPDNIQIITQPGDGEAGSIISGPPSAGVYDIYDNPVSGITIDVSESGAEPLTGTKSLVSDENGEVAFNDLIIDNAGTYQLIFNADAAGVANVTSNSFNIISTGTIHRFKGGSHSGFISTELPEQLLSEPPEVEVPVFTTYEDTLCQGALNTEYIAEAANNDSIRYAITLSAAGSINEETGILDLQADFYGEFYIKATAYGYQGPKEDSIKVVVEPEIDAPVFNNPTLEVCQGAIVTYNASSVHTDSITYSVSPAGSGIIDPNTGQMDWADDFNGTSQITATAGKMDDCGGQKHTTIEVTVNPEVGTPTFDQGGIEFCQDAPNETYTATADHATDIIYSHSPAEAGTMNSSTGEMNWAADFHGTVTITARAEGLCNGPKDKELTVTIHPKPTTSAITGEADVACNATGETYSVDLHTGADYSWSVPSGATITSGESGPENNSITVDFAESSGHIRVTETSQYGCVGDQQELQVTLYGCNLASDFEASETETCEGNVVTFSDLSTGNVDTWEWNFGSGAVPETATGEGPHDVTYPSEGTYTVSLTVKEQTLEDTKTITDYITVSKKGTWLGTQSSNWFDPDNWSCGEVPDNGGPAFDVIIPQSAANYPVISAAGARVKNIEIENGASLSITNDVTLNVYGNWTNNGTFSTNNSTVTFRGDNSQLSGSSVTSFDNLQIITGKKLTPVIDSLDIIGNLIVDGTFEHNNSKVSFTGNAAQQISGTATNLVFHELFVDKSAESITLQREVSVSSYLTLTEGIINSSDSHILQIMSGASSNEGNDTSFVDGPVLKTGNNAYTFPTGNNGIWAPIAITAPDLVSDAFRAQYFYTGHPEAGSDPCNSCGDGIKTVRDTEYWDLSRTAGSSNPDVTMYFKDMARSGISSINNLIYGHWNGSEWVDKTLEGSATLDGNGGCYITGSGFSIYNVHAPAVPAAECPSTGNIYYVPNNFDL